MARPRSQTAALMASPDDTEAQFYEALQRGDLEKLMALWADDDDVVCVHPGGARLIGIAAIRASFAAIFANAPVPVQPEQVRRLHTLSSAVHHLSERVEVITDQGPRSAWTVATNVYVKTALGWRMVAHHASPSTLEEPPQRRDFSATLH